MVESPADSYGADDRTVVWHIRPDSEQLAPLHAADGRLSALIRSIGELRLGLRNDWFAALAGSIVSQQLSVKAAATIWSRVVVAAGGITPERLLALREEQFRGAGVSRPKAAYIQDLARRVSDGELDFAALTLLDDEEVVARLTRVKGVGRWTAEMFLIFSLGRPDVLSLGDAGLKRSLKWLYNDPAAELEACGAAWRPVRSIVSLYLWEAINRGLVDRKEAAAQET